MLIDLTRPICSGMEVWPGDPPVRIEKVLSVNPDGCNLSQIEMGSHSSTHIDAPNHVFEDGKTLDQFDLSHLQGCSMVYHFRQNTDITAQQIEDVDCPIVLFDTGYEKSKFLITLTESAAGFLVEKGVKIVGFDTPSCDNETNTDLPIHKTLLGSEVLIVENLTNLDHISHEKCDIVIAPLLIKNSEAAPCRVFAQLGKVE